MTPNNPDQSSCCKAPLKQFPNMRDGQTVPMMCSKCDKDCGLLEQDLSSCCKAPIKATHGCDDDFLHGGKKCTCEIMTSWYECEKCKRPCDAYSPDQGKPCAQICECVGNGLPICEDCRPHVEGVKSAIKTAEARRSESSKHWWLDELDILLENEAGLGTLSKFVEKVEDQAYERGRLSVL